MNIDIITSELETLVAQGVKGMTDEQIADHRKKILVLTKQCNKALGQTAAKKDFTFTDEDVRLYVNQVLEDGYNLIATKPSTDKRFADAQHVTWYKQIIKSCVQGSRFGYFDFKIEELQIQRSHIENSTTLHDLRQNVKAIIGPLSLYRELTKEPEPIQYELSTEEELMLEVEQLTSELKECKRVISEITKIYDDSLATLREKQQLVAQIDAFKLEHSCSDEEACKVFDISRSTLKRMRKELTEES